MPTDATPHALSQAAVVLAHADGIAINNNHMDNNGALILGPPASSWQGFNKWNANFITYPCELLDSTGWFF
jgi:hypothetical protein